MSSNSSKPEGSLKSLWQRVTSVFARKNNVKNTLADVAHKHNHGGPLSPDKYGRRPRWGAWSVYEK